VLFYIDLAIPSGEHSFLWL